MCFCSAVAQFREASWRGGSALLCDDDTPATARRLRTELHHQSPANTIDAISQLPKGRKQSLETGNRFWAGYSTYRRMRPS